MWALQLHSTKVDWNSFSCNFDIATALHNLHRNRMTNPQYTDLWHLENVCMESNWTES